MTLDKGYFYDILLIKSGQSVPFAFGLPLLLACLGSFAVEDYRWSRCSHWHCSRLGGLVIFSVTQPVAHAGCVTDFDRSHQRPRSQHCRGAYPWSDLGRGYGLIAQAGRSFVAHACTDYDSARHKSLRACDLNCLPKLGLPRAQPTPQGMPLGR